VADLKLDQAAINNLLQSKSGPVAIEVIKRSNRVLNKARRLCPVDEGRLRASLAFELRQGENGDLVGRVGTNVEYAVYVHEGTGIYAGRGMITPKRGKFLAWPVKNNSGQGNRRYKGGSTQKYAFARRVKGQPGKPFLRNALDAGK
jgi:hypothetical protein